MDNTLDQSLGNTERTKNRVAYFWIGGLPGALTIIAGLVETIAALATAIFYGLKSLCHRDIGKKITAQQDAYRALNFVAHGLASMCRGVVELIPIFNLTLLIYDEVFKLRMTYLKEDVPQKYNAIRL